MTFPRYHATTTFNQVPSIASPFCRPVCTSASRMRIRKRTWHGPRRRVRRRRSFTRSMHGSHAIARAPGPQSCSCTVAAGEPASAQLVTLLAAEDRTLAGVVSFYGVYDFLPMVTDAAPRSLTARLFGRTVLDDETRR